MGIYDVDGDDDDNDDDDEDGDDYDGDDGKFPPWQNPTMGICQY